VKLMAAVALESCALAMGGKFERYVSHIRDSKSSRNGAGQPPSSLWSSFRASAFGASAPASFSTWTVSPVRLSSSGIGSEARDAELA
jgi:hypothetical protein